MSASTEPAPRRGVRRGPGMGRAEVWADGSLVRVVDLYAPVSGYATIRLVWGLEDRWHTVKIVVVGSHRAAGSGSAGGVDRWVVAQLPARRISSTLHAGIDSSWTACGR